MVVADEHDSGFDNFLAYLIGREDPLVGAVGIAEVAKIFASDCGIVGANFAFHAGKRVELSYAAPRS